MKETYRSKIGLEIIIPVALIMGGLITVLLVPKDWTGGIIVGCLAAFIIHMFATTYYAIDGNILQVKSGFIINEKIDIATITKIEPTRSILSAPAISFDRLEVFYNKYDSVVISPGDKAGFIAKLKEINNNIKAY